MIRISSVGRYCKERIYDISTIFGAERRGPGPGNFNLVIP